MTGPRELCDRLEALRAQATPGPWQHRWTHCGYAPGAHDEEPVFDGAISDDAALIVAAINALPALLTVVRGAADLADEWDTDDDARYAHNRIAKQTAARSLRAVLAALTADKETSDA